MAERGRTDEVNDHINSIRQQYSGDAGLIYLSALLETDGDRAVGQYQTLCDKYPRNQYCPRAMLKLAEYYYVSGLYIKSGDWLKQYLRQTTNAADKKRALNLLRRSLTISGNADSVNYYLKLFGGSSADDHPETGSAEVPKTGAAKDEVTTPVGRGGYGVQVGLFGSLENAGKRLKLLQSSGYDGQIRITIKNGKAMHAVVIGNYATDVKAREISRQIKASLGLDSFVVKEE
ncbi:MAG: SPOR domain-containing protein [FCB group bacterium]|nr:SPOR domain-containing protein [FCB group bacterium]